MCHSYHMFSPAVLIKAMSNHFLNTKEFLALSVAFHFIPTYYNRTPLFTASTDMNVFYPESLLRIVIYLKANSLCLQIFLLFKLKIKSRFSPFFSSCVIFPLFNEQKVRVQSKIIFTLLCCNSVKRIKLYPSTFAGV